MHWHCKNATVPPVNILLGCSAMEKKRDKRPKSRGSRNTDIFFSPRFYCKEKVLRANCLHILFIAPRYTYMTFYSTERLPQHVWGEGDTQTPDQPQTSDTALGEPSKSLSQSELRYCRPVLLIPKKKKKVGQLNLNLRLRLLSLYHG